MRACNEPNNLSLILDVHMVGENHLHTIPWHIEEHTETQIHIKILNSRILLLKSSMYIVVYYLHLEF